MAKKEAITAIAVNTPVPNVLAALDEKIKSLKHIAETPYKTGGNLDGFGDIKAETKIENLIRAYSMVMGKEKAYHASAADLGLTTYPAFNVNGGNAADWKQDIQLRIAIINHKETFDKLTEFKTKMSSFLSAEDQKSMLLKEMEGFLGKTEA